MTLLDDLPREPTADAVYEAFVGWATEQGLELYPHQEEAAIELVQRQQRHPRHADRLRQVDRRGRRALRRARRRPPHLLHRADQGARVGEVLRPVRDLRRRERRHAHRRRGRQRRAPIVCCTAEVLANIALREGADADVGQVVMDEFHFYAEPQRGWAWQVPLLTLPQAQFLLMSATLGDMAALREDLTRRTGRETALIDDAERPVPLVFSYSLEPLHELLEELVRADRAPAYVVHFTQASALERAQTLLSAKLCTREERDAIAEAIGAFRFTAGFGKTLSRLVRGRHRRPPRRDAAALPAAGRAARADRAAEGDLRDGHARRRHQRPDPHRRLHRPGEVRRRAPPAAQGARVPPDRRPRGPGRASTPRATSSSRRPSTRSRTRVRRPRRATTPKKRKAVQAQGRRRHRLLDGGDLRAPARRDRRSRSSRACASTTR